MKTLLVFLGVAAVAAAKLSVQSVDAANHGLVLDRKMKALGADRAVDIELDAAMRNQAMFHGEIDVRSMSHMSLLFMM
jgi:hypothetical protein